MADLIEIRAEKARRSLAEFVRQAWPIIEPETLLVWNWHLDVICDHVQALVERRLGKQNLVINVPPGSMKSTIVSVCLPAWIWAQRKEHPTSGPAWRGLFLAGSEDVAHRDSMKCRDILESTWYLETFRPTWKFAKDQNAKGFYKNSSKGFRKCQPAGAKITGQRASGIFVDDPNDASLDSKAARDQINYWWDNGAANRISSPATGTRCLIQQRLNEEDLTGHIMAKERQDWDALIIRQKYEHPVDKDLDRESTGLGWSDHRTVEGELMFPAMFSADWVSAEHRRLAGSGYAGQHQQRPSSKDGEIFKKGFVKFFRLGTEPTFSRKILSADTAFKEGQLNDFSVLLTIGECREPMRAGLWFTNRWKERASYPNLRDKAKLQGAAVRPMAFLVEDKASGQSLIQDLKRDTGLPILPIVPDGDKVYRAKLCVPAWEAGTIWLPEDADWTDDFLEQLYGFPNMAHDDDVDAFTQAVRYLVGGPAPITINKTLLGRR